MTNVYSSVCNFKFLTLDVRSLAVASRSKERNTKKDESYLPPCNVFGGIWRSFGGIWRSFGSIWRSFGGAAYWAVCNSCLGVASPLAKPASTQSQ